MPVRLVPLFRELSPGTLKGPGTAFGGYSLTTTDAEASNGFVRIAREKRYG